VIPGQSTDASKAVYMAYFLPSTFVTFARCSRAQGDLFCGAWLCVVSGGNTDRHRARNRSRGIVQVLYTRNHCAIEMARANDRVSGVWRA
jgi:hypothetical protein